MHGRLGDYYTLPHFLTVHNEQQDSFVSVVFLITDLNSANPEETNMTASRVWDWPVSPSLCNLASPPNPEPMATLMKEVGLPCPARHLRQLSMLY